MGTVRLARMAMACRFELVLQGEDEPWLRAAGEEALREIERLETRLSRFLPASDVSRINAHASQKAVPVEPWLFDLLKHSLYLHHCTDGAFDLTVGPLMQAWGFYGDGGRVPDADELAEARLRTGMHLVELDEAHRTVRFAHEGVALDFGAIGKGYAVDEAMHLLREAGVERAFLHGGASTMYGIGQPLDADSWNVAVVDPRSPDEPIAVVAIRDEALSVSAVSGKFFEVEGTCYGHVLDPRLGKPVRGALLAATVTSSAATADAVSTALLVHARPLPGYRSLVIRPDGEGPLPRRILHHGILPHRAPESIPTPPPAPALNGHATTLQQHPPS